MHTVKLSNSSIWPIDETLTSTATLGQSGPGSYGNEGVLLIPQNTSTRTSSSDYLVPYPAHSLGGGSYPSAELQLAYSMSPANRAPQY